ncbi:MAG: DUF2842 domain-containing protein [Brevundimonas sp.]|nr:MAG: DUF2842 domain-containing protein [Brevundimonas sp.]
MGPRARRAVAAVGVLAFLAFYVWAVITIGAWLPQHPLVHLIFYGLAGIGWTLPILPLLSWAEKPPRGR